MTIEQDLRGSAREVDSINPRIQTKQSHFCDGRANDVARRSELGLPWFLFCWKAKLSKDFRFAFWYLYATDEILYTTSEVEDPRKKHKYLNLFKQWLGPSKLLRCIYRCQKWIPDKIPHRNSNPKKISTFFFVEKKNIFWKWF